jgi:hypothetical protein
MSVESQSYMPFHAFTSQSPLQCQSMRQKLKNQFLLLTIYRLSGTAPFAGARKSVMRKGFLCNSSLR